MFVTETPHSILSISRTGGYQTVICRKSLLNLSFRIALWIFIMISSLGPESNQPAVAKVAWLSRLRSIGQPGAMVVTLEFWALVYSGRSTLTTIWMHAINSVVVWLDILTSCYEPSRRSVCCTMYMCWLSEIRNQLCGVVRHSLPCKHSRQDQIMNPSHRYI